MPEAAARLPAGCRWATAQAGKRRGTSAQRPIAETDILQFAGAGGFDSKITLGEYNDSTTLRASGGSDLSDGNTPNNVKIIS